MRKLTCSQCGTTHELRIAHNLTGLKCSCGKVYTDEVCATLPPENNEYDAVEDVDFPVTLAIGYQQRKPKLTGFLSITFSENNLGTVSGRDSISRVLTMEYDDRDKSNFFFSYRAPNWDLNIAMERLYDSLTTFNIGTLE